MRRGKYNARKTTYEGIRFDSMREGTRYLDLRMLQRAGEVVELQVHPTFELRGEPSVRWLVQASIDVDGPDPLPPIGKYTPDFLIIYATGEIVVEDVKGVRTRDYILRKKLFEVCHWPLVVTEV